MVATRAPGRDRARWILAPVALLLVLSALSLPLWTSALSAPQYPEGLELVVYGNRAEGDLVEIESLNHYVGMRPLRMEELPELALWPLGLGAAGVAVLVGLLRRRILARLARIYLWAFPVSILAVIQLRLHQFGHDLDPGAAFRMEGFTPWVVGPTRVWNFTAWGWPGLAIFALLGAAALVTFGPALVRRVGSSSRRAPAVAAIVALTLVAPWPALADTGDEHSGHGEWPAAPAPASLVEGVTVTHALPSQVELDQERLIDLGSLIAGTPEGGVLTLPAGAYRGDVVVDRPMTIEGVGMPLVVGGGEGTVLTIEAAGTTIRGIHLTGSGHGPGGQPAGIRVVADDVELDSVVVGDSYIGIAVDDVEKVRILNSLIMGRSVWAIGGEGHAVDGSHDGHGGGRGDGISIWEAESVLIRGTRIEGVRDGVYASFGSSILVDSNQVHSSRYAVHTMYTKELVIIENHFEANLSGAILMYGGQVDVIRNMIVGNISPSTGFGVLLKDVTDAEVVQNGLAGNRVGIHVDGPTGGAGPTMVIANTVAENQFGVVVFPSASVTFLANSFVDNLVQVSQHGRGSAGDVAWADRGWGNYWSTYRGFDNGRGRGVVPHTEATSMNRVLVRSPLLTSLAASPAMRIVTAVEDRWLRLTPVAVDELPLTSPVSPPIPVPAPDPAAVVVAAIVGFAASVVATGSFIRLSRRPRVRGAI